MGRITLRVRFVVVVVLWDLFKVEAIIPAALLCEMAVTFYLILLAMAIWLRDLLRDILVMESSD